MSQYPPEKTYQNNSNQDSYQNSYQPPQQMNEKPQGPIALSNPPSRFGSKWGFGLFDCFSPLSTCCLGCWCPCILYGKTYAREHGETDPSGCSGMCCLWYLAASVGFNSCLQCVTRSQQREKHGIEGSSFGDFCATFWCPCCTLVQEEKESQIRLTGINPKTQIAYQPNQGMQYPA